MRNLIHKTTIAAALGALMLGGTLAHAAAALPAVHRSGAVEYLSGGIGRDEAKAIESAGKEWPLMLEFAVKDRQRADFAADVKVIVRDAGGRAALHVTSKGPFLLARLAPGRYAVDATLADKTLHENILVQHGHPARAVFVWPAGTNESRSS